MFPNANNSAADKRWSSERKGYFPFNDKPTLVCPDRLSPTDNKRRKISIDSDIPEPVSERVDSTRYSRQDSAFYTPPTSPPNINSIGEGKSQYPPPRPPPPALYPESNYQTTMEARRPTLPSLGAQYPPRDQFPHHYTYGEAPMEASSRSIHPSSHGRPHDPTRAYSQPYAYEHEPYHQPRHPYPFTIPFSSGYHQQYHDGYHDMGQDTKQRKRRGNLPKDTTDKLRTWFHAHLTHPYPTEDEKQDLMNRTGLQMSKLILRRICGCMNLRIENRSN